MISEGCGRDIIKRPPYVRPFVRPSVHLFTLTLTSHSFIKIYSPNLQGMFMAIKTCLQSFGLILKNKMDAIANCLKIIKVL